MTIPPRPDNGTEWVYMNSNTVYLNATEISHLSDRDTKIALYEMYARHGCIFEDTDMATYFSRLSWYKGTVSEGRFLESVFNAIEKWNADLLKKEADKRGIQKPGDSATVTRPARAPLPGRRPSTNKDPKRPTGRKQ